MSDTLRPIDARPFEERLGDCRGEPGPMPTLQWIAIKKLRVDESYQREISRRGIDNILRIAVEFDWSKFAPVIVAHIGGSIYVIIDGQHRTTAAALRRYAKVPCCEVVADRARQAAAFAAINAQVTAITPMQLHFARLAAGDPAAAELATVIAQAGASICRYPVPASKMAPGETVAAGRLASLLRRFGRDVLVPALKCVTRTRKGNPGLLRAPIIEAACAVLDAEPDWRADEGALIAAMNHFDFAAEFAKAGARSYAERCSIASVLVERIADHLERRMETPS